MRPSTCGVDASLLTVSVLERRLPCMAKGVSVMSMPHCIKAHCISKLLSIKPEYLCRWFPKGKVVFVAPTRPLVEQQRQACLQTLCIPEDRVEVMTGQSMKPAARRELWEKKTVFFCTAQVQVTHWLSLHAWSAQCNDTVQQQTPCHIWSMGDGTSLALMCLCIAGNCSRLYHVHHIPSTWTAAPQAQLLGLAVEQYVSSVSLSCSNVNSCAATSTAVQSDQHRHLVALHLCLSERPSRAIDAASPLKRSFRHVHMRSVIRPLPFDLPASLNWGPTEKNNVNATGRSHMQARRQALRPTFAGAAKTLLPIDGPSTSPVHAGSAERPREGAVPCRAPRVPRGGRMPQGDRRCGDRVRHPQHLCAPCVRAPHHRPLCDPRLRLREDPGGHLERARLPGHVFWRGGPRGQEIPPRAGVRADRGRVHRRGAALRGCAEGGSERAAVPPRTGRAYRHHDFNHLGVHDHQSVQIANVCWCQVCFEAVAYVLLLSV